LILAGFHFLLRLHSRAYGPSHNWTGSLAPPLVLFGVTLGGLYLLFVCRLPAGRPGWAVVVWIVGVGLFCRACFFGTTPMLQNDHYRYLWDGGFVAHGFDPYAFSPKQVLEGDGVPPGGLDLARAAYPVVQRINHPEVRTIYPPLAQAAFAAAHRLTP